MSALTPTQLRKDLYAQLDHALKGVPVHIHTRRGNAVLISEEALDRRTRRKMAKAGREIPGIIRGRLEEADRELEEHLELPQ